MTPVQEILMDYALNYRLPRYLEQPDWDQSKALESKHLAALRDGLSAERAVSLDRLLEAWEESRNMELQAVFLAAFSTARDLYAGL